ncbi:MAG: hypothetical protein NTV81_01995 [Candidatus Komeilibacteria bacterium]|nr:hypothetical protein [Candidatus Komeilibacteria bacterium]
MKNITFEVCSLEEEKDNADRAQIETSFFKQHNIRFSASAGNVEEEYLNNQQKYQSFKDNLESRWLVEASDFIERLIKFFHENDNKIFKVKICNYAALGFYDSAKNCVFINLNCAPLDPVRIAKHELIHIMVQPFIDEYKIQHEQKEKIVNALLEVLA